MAGSIAKAYVQIVPSADGIGNKLSSVFGSEMPSAGQNAGNILGSNIVKTITKIVAAAGIGKMIADSISAGADMEQSLGGIETLFKDSADTVIKNAEQAYKTAGMSANEYMETVTSFSASLLQGLAGDTEAAATVADMALTDMSDNANKMGTDMQMIQNAYQGFAKQNYTMLDNLKLGYGGTKTEMERLLEDAQKLSGVEYDINNLADVYQAIHVIQMEMGITGTTAKEASETLSGSFASVKASYDNLLANLALGRDIDASLQALTETTSTWLLNNFLPTVGRVLEGLPTILAGAFKAAIEALNIAADNADVILEQGASFCMGIAEAIISAAPQLIEAGLKLVVALGVGIIEAIPDALLAIGELLADLGEAIADVDWIQIGKDIINGLIRGIGNMGGMLWQAAQNIAARALNAIKDFFGIASPSKVMRDEIGQFIPAGIAVGIEANTKPLTDAMHDLSDLTTDTLNADLNISNSVPAANPNHSPGDNTVTINVYATENQDVNELAEILMQKIEFAVSRKEASLA